MSDKNVILFPGVAQDRARQILDYLTQPLRDGAAGTRERIDAQRFPPEARSEVVEMALNAVRDILTRELAPPPSDEQK